MKNKKENTEETQGVKSRKASFSSTLRGYKAQVMNLKELNVLPDEDIATLRRIGEDLVKKFIGLNMFD